MADHEAKKVSVQDIWYQGQRVIRTVIQVGIPAFITFAAVLPLIIDALGLPLDSGVYLWLVAAAAIVTAVAGALSRVMAIPAVNTWLTKIGVGSVPKQVAVRQAQAERVTEVSPPQITDGSDQIK